MEDGTRIGPVFARIEILHSLKAHMLGPFVSCNEADEPRHHVQAGSRLF